MKGSFEHGNAEMYGIREPAGYLCLDLLWGAKLCKKTRFVLVKSSGGGVYPGVFRPGAGSYFYH